jgi:ADP-ribose pyrophosphatase
MADDGRVGRLDSRPIYEGRVVRLSVDTVRFPDGSVGELEMIRHPGASAVLPLVGSPSDEDPDVLLLRQYRYAAGGELYEVPAGLPSGPDESWDDCARRELEEETGFRAGRLRALTRIYTTPGFTDEVIRLYLAWDLEAGEPRLDDDEFVEVVRVPLSTAVEMVRDGRMVDCKSVATVLWAARFGLMDDRNAAEEGGG